MRKTFKAILVAVVLVVVMAVTLTGCAPKAGTNVVVNGDFEKLTTKNAPEGWETYESDGVNGTFNRVAVAQGSEENQTLGFSYLTVKLSGDKKAAYYQQKIKLYAGQTYAFSVDYRIDDSMSLDASKKGAVGGYFGLLEDSGFTTLSATDTDGSWVTRTVYIKPAVTATYTLVCGIGREDIGGATGEIAFDNVSIKTINKADVPVGLNVEQVSPAQKIDSTMYGGIAYTVVFTVFGVALMIGAYFLMRKFTQNKNDAMIVDNELSKDKTNKPDVDSVPAKTPFKEKFKKENLGKTFTSPMALFIYVLITAFLTRFLFVLVSFGMGDTIARYGELALSMANDGFKMGYSGELSLPSGYLYLLYIIGLIADAVNLTVSSLGMSILIRTPNVIADVIICYLIFVAIGKNYSHKISAVVAGLYAINPVFFTMSTTYGANFSIALAFIVGMVMFMLTKNYIGAVSMYTLAFMFSYDALLLLPLIIFFDIYYCIKDKNAILPIVVSSLVALVVFYLAGLPFAIHLMKGETVTKGVFLVFTKILDSIKSNVLVTNSTFNLYAIFGLGANASNTAIKVIGIIWFAVFVGLLAYYYMNSKNRLDYIYIAAMLLIVWTVFGVGAKLETMVLGIALLLLYTGLKCERRLFVGTTILSISTFVNASVLMTYSGFINTTISKTAGYVPFYYLDPLLIIGSIINVITVLYLLYVGYDIMVKQMEADIRPMPEHYFRDTKSNLKATWDRITDNFKKVFKRG